MLAWPRIKVKWQDAILETRSIYSVSTLKATVCLRTRWPRRRAPGLGISTIDQGMCPTSDSEIPVDLLFDLLARLCKRQTWKVLRIGTNPIYAVKHHVLDLNTFPICTVTYEPLSSKQPALSALSGKNTKTTSVD